MTDSFKASGLLLWPDKYKKMTSAVSDQTTSHRHVLWNQVTVTKLGTIRAHLTLAAGFEPRLGSIK